MNGGLATYLNKPQRQVGRSVANSPSINYTCNKVNPIYGEGEALFLSLWRGNLIPPHDQCITVRLVAVHTSVFTAL
jgi:hypothetical protein